MKIFRNKPRANSGYTRILETLIAATIIFIVFAASSFLVSSSQIKVVQEKTDLDRLGYNALSRLTESGAVEAIVENPQVSNYQLKAFLQHSLPSSIFFNLTLMKWSLTDMEWAELELPPISNAEFNSFSDALELSSTRIIYTSKNGNIYTLILVLANAGEGV